ncbi:Diadenosine tetraphosphatase and related serine/threonine protein phosphatase [Lentisphaera araneosa HTCC2155]|uniref:Diadenosine tetraphosphatase and related serine/threonine protein phosphatase n=1 Tax=Lentisphaera araneosa HTCC2155 TaxID=313628 RepID=A6DIJ8_9BACT|nr:metallophosphoesterase [Lentisphaera araneosa]EDM28284.1 Diadenosine tetraphosphatase and related serine/threonine protein phosphatase [Lentisphaera araneosa HTCC2155]
MNKYDVIGDVHGYADELEVLLKKLGYQKISGVYRHPQGRQVIFIGDLIDKGPKIRQVLEIAKSMCDEGTALAVLGNHEYNAICYHTMDRSGLSPLRANEGNNLTQHQETLLAFKEHESEWKTYLKWFRSLPIYLNLEGLNIVHACWDEKYIGFLENQQNNYGAHALKDDEFLYASAIKNSKEYNAIENLLKGKEVGLPEGKCFLDKGNNERSRIRTQWWLSKPDLIDVKSSMEIALTVPEVSQASLQDVEFDFGQMKEGFIGLPNTGLTLVGHYTFKNEAAPINERIACLDYSGAKALMAYSWSGEPTLLKENFTMV